MEKLKAKHDHKLTDILKVAIFGLMLILPGIMFLPSCMYYAVNKYATPPTSQVENTTQIELKQNIINGKPSSSTGWIEDIGEYESLMYEDNSIYFQSINSENYLYTDIENFTLNQYDIVLFKTKIKGNIIGSLYYFALDTDYDYNFYLLSSEITTSFSDENNYQEFTFLKTYDTDTTTYNTICFCFENINSVEINVIDTQLFNLTQIYGSGNEPTIEEFNETWKQEYYEYNIKYYADIPNGTYTTYTDIPKELDLQWQSLWNKPILKWTNTTILKEGLDNFTGVFGVSSTSYLTNLIAYELIMVAIYIVIDIVLTLFKWLTHLIGEK